MKQFSYVLIILGAIFLWPLGIIPIIVWTKWKLWVKILFCLPVIPAVVFTLIYIFIAQPIKISGYSMSPTLVNGDYLLIEKLSKSFKRGDIVVYKNPDDKTQLGIGRIIGLPGEQIIIDDRTVSINGQILDEPYAKGATEYREGGNFRTFNVREEEYFLLGDNRPRSFDSRLTGTIKKDNIVGKYWFSYYQP